MRKYLLCLLACSFLCSCDALFHSFLDPAPLDCPACPGGQICNLSTHACEAADLGATDAGATGDGSTPPPASGLSILAGKIGGQGNADDSGSAARFGLPTGVAADNAGNVYIVDSGTNTIRKLVLATGLVSTVAGSSGIVGSQNGTGASASFNNPQGAAIDNQGNLYVSDSMNYTIRKVVVSTGAVTTIAGLAGSGGTTDGIGTTAQFMNPQGLALDGGGNLNGDYGSAYIG